MIRKAFGIILALVAALPFGAFSESNDAIFNELGNYLMYIDKLMEDELFAIEYVEKFNETRTQDDLLIARTAINSALREVESMEIPLSSMTEDEYFSYMDIGAEVESLALLYENLQVVKSEKILRLSSMYETMLADLYFEPALDNLMEKIALYRMDILYEARDAVYMTNYLLLQLEKGGQTDRFWNVIKDNTSVLKNEMDVFYSDPDQLAQMAGDNLDEMGINTGNLEVLGGFLDYFLQITLDAAQANDLTVFKNNRTKIAGETQVFPMPEWQIPTDAEYIYIFTDPETEELSIHTMGSEITDAPDQIKITYNGITIDEISEYIDSLMILEYNPVYEFASEGDDISLYVMADKGGSTLMIVWNEAQTAFYLTPPAASLVPYMYWE